jgi:soluble lytic murein transglycosylase-like protein
MSPGFLATLSRIRWLETQLAAEAAAPPAGPREHAPEDFRGLVERVARRYGLDPALVDAVVRAESGYDPQATSPAGAMGLMQLMPATARALGVVDPYDPVQNVEGGVRYLRGLLDRFGDVTLALAAYNAGPGAVTRYGGVPPYRETRAYVERVLSTWQRLRAGGER